MSKSLHARKSIAKITALPNCTNMAGGGGFTGSSKKTSHVRSRFGLGQKCVKCQFGFSNQWIMPGAFKMKHSQFSANSARRTRLISCEDHKRATMVSATMDASGGTMETSS